MRHRHFAPLLLAPLMALTLPAFAQTTKTGKSMTEPQVRELLTKAGYTEIDDLDFEDGMWETDATSGNRKRVDVRVDPASGQIYAEALVSQLSENDIKAKLSAAGYSNVHDVDFDDGLWKAEAERADGKDVEVHLSATDGSIIHVEND
ncbi:PepSY domain-containing protein [Pseudoxanthomonas composti]|uniref:PepSY domain-containing protein n=1 Tax=Pseudoxanthomonas composti TaxID=2137479 RepID=A0A4Q1JV77_9GAMM|nr:PepSY domain-containing protein [Pseudoxanthomonas composti]RXR05953.1 PepSY domain-containing protein [Pseudoxanthomonas composti]